MGTGEESPRSPEHAGTDVLGIARDGDPRYGTAAGQLVHGLTKNTQFNGGIIKCSRCDITYIQGGHEILGPGELRTVVKPTRKGRNFSLCLSIDNSFVALWTINL